MKSILNPLFLALLVLVPIAGNAQSSTNTEQRHIFKPGSFILILKSDKTNYVAGKSIKLTILAENIGKENADASVAYPMCLYDAFVSLTNGIVIPPTPGGKQAVLNAKMGGSFSYTTLRPGESEATSSDFPLSEIFDLSVPNIYKIKVTREFPNGYDKAKNAVTWVKVVSNEIEIEVMASPLK